MQQSFTEVKPEDFMKIGGDKPPHLLIEEALISIGGRGTSGTQYKKEILKLAGWTGGSLTTYASRSDIAASAFNRVRKALENTSDPEDLKVKLQH